MFRDLKFQRRGSTKNEEIENVPQNPRDLPPPYSGLTESAARAPLNTIQEPKQEYEAGCRSRVDRTPTKHKVGNKFGWGQGTELPSATPRSMRNLVKGGSSSVHTESNSTQSTPSKSVSKPPPMSVRSKGDYRGAIFTPLYRGVMVSSSSSTAVVNSEKVPHFDLREDPSFWMDHSVQVIIRVRPLNSMEKGMNGYSRCLKQESAHSITWIGQPEVRFTFDQVACESIDQETLFRMAGLPMVENCLSGYNSCMFAYGQTGSGKTYTMLGENEDIEIKPSLHRGMTPRIFEFLFARIQAEEESRRDEKLKYSCKCSFLEIYNEQITDLLEPSSTNLLLREDVKKGVYVENLSEFEVWSVSDILKLLVQGSSNRRVAATNMNRESSRSHCVFTCIIESRWEKDSTTNLRFARLNLVDLAGSERQKTSGADGERLREAANINKSLSSLGHVIMVLVDVANGKPRHIPYRDSRLTFLLQDSLGGNSKTMIIANVSPSICCASETLHTLKFAQRAKLIQNNAVVNEDSTGDVVALQNQLRLLKEEISALKRQIVSRSLSFGSPASGDLLHEQENGSNRQKLVVADQHNFEDCLGSESKGIVRLSTKQLKSLETTLAGALRREQMAESSIKQLEAEIEQLNRLVSQREEDTRRSKMMLKFREDKIHKMENLLGGLMPVENYLVEENWRLSEENQLLQAKIDRNPEVTRFALENIRLLDQLRRFQEFYEEGERDILITEVSNMRDQLLQLLDGNSAQTDHPSTVVEPQLESTLSELEACKKSLDSCVEENAKLNREIKELRAMLIQPKPAPCGLDGTPEITKDSLEASPLVNAKKNPSQNKRLERKIESLPLKHAEEIMNLQLELDILKIILTEEKSARSIVEERAKRLDMDLNLAKEKLSLTSKEFADVDAERKEAKAIIEVVESQQILAINEMENLKISNSCHLELLNKKELEIAALKEQLSRQEFRDQQCSKKLKGEDYPLHAKLTKMQDSLEKAKRLNIWYKSYCDVEASNEEEMEEVRRQVEGETAEVIVCMQEELASLQQQVQEGHSKEIETQKNVMLMKTRFKEVEDKLFLVNEENEQLRDNHEKKDAELKELSEEWELLTCELEEILANGHEELSDASDQLDFITGLFPQKRIWISDHVGQMMRIMSEKDLIIQDLTKCLEDADNRRTEVETMLNSLKGATRAITEAHQQVCSERESEILLLTSQLSAKISSIAILEERMKLAEDQNEKLSVCATTAFVIVNRYSEINLDHLHVIDHKDFQIRDLNEMILKKNALLRDQAADIVEAEERIQLLRKQLTESEKLCAELQMKLSEEERRVLAMEQKLEDVQEDDIRKTREKLVELKTGVSTLRSCMSMFVEQQTKNQGNDEHGSQTSWDAPNELQKDSEMNDQNKKDLLFIEGTSTGSSGCHPNEQNYFKSQQTINKVCDGDVTISLLRKELEFGLESLKEVQAEMTKLRDEKEEICMSDKQSQESLRCLTMQILSLQASIVNFEQQCAKKLEAFSHKLHFFEQIVEETVTCCYQTKEMLTLEVSEARKTAVQKMDEASCIFSNFEVAQKKMKESEITIKELMIANETLKLDVERLVAVEVIVRNERDILITKVQDLQTINDSKSQQIENLENQIESSFIETRDLVVELEEAVAQFQNTVIEQLMPLVLDFRKTNSLYVNSSKLVRSWLEKIWSEIIAKDCALSVLHLCHIGVMLETVTGLNVVNGLLQHDLCESNSVVADLREHNNKSRSELESCRVLKGKLLGDIKTSFNRISRNEEETGQLGVKLSDFEKRISDLQSQEELMLQRFNSMGSQLASLMKELDSSNSSVMESLLDHNKLMEDKDDELKLQEELYILELCSKDLQSLIFTSRMEEVYFQKSVFENQCNIHCTVFENLEKEIIISHVDAELMKQILVEKDFQIVLLEKEVEEAAKGFSTLELQNQKLEQDIQTLEVSVCRLQNEMEMKDLKLCSIKSLEEEKQMLLNQISDVESSMSGLQSELLRKDDVIKGLSFDLSLLQESAANTTDQKDEIDRLCASLQDLDYELGVRTSELNDVNARCLTFETRLQEKTSTVSVLELNTLEHCETIKFLRAESDQLRAQAHSLLEERKSMEVELSEERKANENLGMEVSQLGNVIDQLNELVELLNYNLDQLTAERDRLKREIQNLKTNIERVQAQAKANEENANEAQQLAESRKAFALEKEEEVKLLERSVEELECTVNVLENKVDLIKGEAERQRLQREDLELELHAVKHQLQNIKNADADLKSQLDVKEKSLQEALRDMKALEMDVAEKGAEIKKLTFHIGELNLHAEAQASEYKQKFKELEAMVEQGGMDFPSTHIQNCSSNKSDKLAVRSRGSGSPFKCMGLGLAQQMKSERDEEITAAKKRIEELESLVVSRQKEIFALNARLASAESMTHDVIRDLLGVKLDVTTYASMLDNQQVQRIAKKSQILTPESQDQEVDKLKQQLRELIEQRKGLLDEIDRRQAELVATQISLEQLCQQDQLLKTEYEMLKAENVNHKKKLMELEGEVKRLSGQQNLQQRIHHHTKIKEENNMLKLRIEELSSKLHRNELRLARAKEELARHRAFCQEANLIA